MEILELLYVLVGYSLQSCFILIIALVLFKYASSGKIEEVEGSLVVAIDSAEDWNEAIDSSKDSDALIVVDFYATWCPPCRAAAPIFGNLSKEYCADSKKCRFLKVDVDKASAVARAQGVRAMPTFLFFKRGRKVGEMVGWSESKLIDTIKANRSFV